MDSPLPKPLALDFLDAGGSQLIPSLTVTQKEFKVSLNSFIDKCEELWQAKGQINHYQKGMFLGKGDSTNLLFEEFLKKLRKTIEDIIREELKINGQTSENYRDIFKAIESIFGVLIMQLQIGKVAVKNERFLPILHGFINSYVNSVMGRDKDG